MVVDHNGSYTMDVPDSQSVDRNIRSALAWLSAHPKATLSDKEAYVSSQVHGGELKAVYIYAADHYDHWRSELNRDLPHGQFGENLTVAGALEDVVRIGDTLRVGGALLAVTQPRMPCYKLDIKMEQPEFMKQFLASGRTGFYVRVLEEGEIGAGDEMSVIETDASRPTVLAVVRRESASG